MRKNCYLLVALALLAIQVITAVAVATHSTWGQGSNDAYAKTFLAITLPWVFFFEIPKRNADSMTNLLILLGFLNFGRAFWMAGMGVKGDWSVVLSLISAPAFGVAWASWWNVFKEETLSAADSEAKA